MRFLRIMLLSMKAAAVRTLFSCFLMFLFEKSMQNERNLSSLRAKLYCEHNAPGSHLNSLGKNPGLRFSSVIRAEFQCKQKKAILFSHETIRVLFQIEIFFILLNSSDKVPAKLIQIRSDTT